MSKTSQHTSIYTKLGIYIHVPWCHRRCPYCDFYFEIGKPEAGFADALMLDWEFKRQFLPNSQQKDPFESLYFGGGTPSRLPIEDLAGIVSYFRPRLMNHAEITLEANPEDVTPETAKDWLELGINRLSLGVQSLDDQVLHWLGRKHRRAEALDAAKIATQYFDEVSVDFIVGVPGEDVNQIKESIQALRELGVDHISAYILGIEPTAPLHRLIQRGIRTLPTEAEQADAYLALQKMLEDVGYRQYEVSNFSVPGHESRHNRTYWGKGQYIGLGPSAHSMVRQIDGCVHRFSSIRDYKQWRNAPSNSLDFQEKLPPEHAFLEGLAFGCRDIQMGVDIETMAKLHGITPSPRLLDLVSKLAKENFLWKSGFKLGLNPSKALFADHVSRELLGSG